MPGKTIHYSSLLVVIALIISNGGFAQRPRTQYPDYFSQSYFGVNIGYINYPFSNEHMEPGYTAESVEVPHTGVRLMLYGWQLNDYLAAQISYMRPVLWVVYRNVNEQITRHSVWMNIAGLSLKPQLAVGKKLSLFGEVGMSIITRHGFSILYQPVVRDANYASVLLGAGLKYHLNDRWDLMVHSVWSPENKMARQPHTFFFSPGFQYNMRPLPDEKVQHNLHSGFIFPKNQLQIGYTTNALGYGVNAFFSDGAIPVFWGGDVIVEKGLMLNYNRNVFHGRKTFALDFGAAFGYFETEHHHTPFFALSVYPVLRFTVIRTKPADLYCFYSVAGPTFLSHAVIDGIDTGRRFTFYDYMGMGLFAGKNRTFSAEAKIGHYSNGNLFPQNPGVKIPLTFSLGYNF